MRKILLLGSLYTLLFLSCRQKLVKPVIKPGRDYEKAVSFIDKQNDSAFYYFNRVTVQSRDRLLVAAAYNQMGVIQASAGDYFGSQESLLASLKYLRENELAHWSCLSSDFNELGMSSLALKNYDEAIAYEDLAIRYTKDPTYRLIFLNNKALALQKKGAYGESVKLYRSVLNQVPREGREYARVLSNIARTQWLWHRNYPAAAQLQEALRIRQEAGDDWGLNASYAHLSDYYSGTRSDSALFYARQMHRIARQLQSPDDELEALQKLIRLAPAPQVKGLFTRYEHLNDSLQTTRNAAKNQFALIRYQAEKHKTDNLRLQRDNAEQENQLLRQKMMSGSMLLLLFTSIGTGWLWFRKRQERMRLEKENAVKEKEYYILKKVHDVVANGVYRVMKDLQYRRELNRKDLVNQLDRLYESSRMISYHASGEPEEGYQEDLSQLLRSFGHEGVRIIIAGNEEELWAKVSPEVRAAIRETLLELMVNMDKHSRATQVVVKFDETEGRLCITYSDNGIGFAADHRFGNGLQNTENRIREYGGDLTFEKPKKGGLQIRLIWPIS